MKRTRIQLVKLTEIPPLPIASQRILATISQEYVTLTEVTEAVKPSPEITAQILRAANSAYFGFSGEVTSVDDAIKRVLGLDIVKSFVMVALLDKPFNSSQVPSFCSPSAHSFACLSLETTFHRLLKRWHSQVQGLNAAGSSTGQDLPSTIVLFTDIATALISSSYC